MDTQPTIALYGDSFLTSPYVFSCYVTLREKSLPFEYRGVALYKGEQRAADYARQSITSKVPALRHGEFWLAESSAIIEYLEESFPDARRVLPAAPRDRARARQVMSWIRSSLMPIREERQTQTVFYKMPVKPLSDAGRAAAAQLFAAADRLLPPGATNLFGAWSIADADLAMMLQRLVAHGDDVPARLRAYATAQWQRPAVREFVEHARMPFVE